MAQVAFMLKNGIVTNVRPNGNVDPKGIQTRTELDQIMDVAAYAATQLGDPKSRLTKQVVERCAVIAAYLDLADSVRLQLELAARIHRVGELYLHKDLRDKCFIDMNLHELYVYNHYPIFSALRLGRNIRSPIHDIVLLHREYANKAGFLTTTGANAIPLAAMILCAATEYEEMIMYRGHDVGQQDTIQRFMINNLARRYDATVIEGLACSFSEQVH